MYIVVFVCLIVSGFTISLFSLKHHQKNKIFPLIASDITDVLPSEQLLSQYNYANRQERDYKLTYSTDLRGYMLGKTPMTYVNEVVARCFPPFNEEQQAELKACKSEESAKLLREKWAAGNEEARKVGRFLHSQIENQLLRRRSQISYYYHYEGQCVSVSHPVSIIPEMNQFALFWKKNTLTPYRSAWVIFDETSHLVGMVDLLAQDDSGAFVLMDWTRSRTFGKEQGVEFVVNKENLFANGLDELQSLPDTPFFRTSLQLNVLRLILRRNYDINVNRMFAVVFHSQNRNYHQIDIPFMEQEAQTLLDKVYE